MIQDAKNGEHLPDAVDDGGEVIAEALQMLKELDNTPPSQMSPLFYQHWFEQLNMTTRDLLRVLGHDPDVSEDGRGRGHRPKPLSKAL
jgi:hypothetical protein